MTTFSMQRVLWVLSLATAFALSSCGGCAGKKRSNKNNGATAEDPKPEEPKDDGKKPDGTVIDNKDVGEEVPPITPDKVATIDTSAGAALKHLVLKTTGAQEAGRYLSEFLMVIRANEDSCVRLKVRPTSGLTTELQDDALVSEIEGTGACEGQKIGGDGQDQPAATPTTPAAGLWLNELPDTDVADNSRRSQGFSLTAPALAECSSRLFRMISDGIEPVVVKTGRLYKGPTKSKVRVWLDEEFANVCGSDNKFTPAAPIAFAPLEIGGHLPSQVLDQLTKKHIDNLIAEMNKIVSQITGTFGAVSDIDQSGHIEIFISPDVNRHHFAKYNSTSIDHFKAELIYRPEDLAYFNAETNPTSNEGEILYLWSPDPAGIYTNGSFPSADSLSSNYAKGYLTAQIATLIFANQKLFVQKLKTMEERWVVESVASLLSAYYAGNDYTFPYLIQYLTSRPQYLSLSQPPTTALFSDKFLPTAFDEAFGMRAMFGWYMHAKLCGTGVDACDKLKDLISSKLIGKKNVEAVVGLAFDKLLENFGLSVGVNLLDRPAEALKFWDKTPLPADYPSPPTTMPPLTEIFAAAADADKRQTEEANDAAVILGGSKLDRGVAGPFPSKDMLIFQPVASDNDIEFKVAKDAVVYLLVTGLVDPQTDVTAVFGKGLNVVFVPAGERDTSLRRLHVEKVSEQAHGDLRPENLTNATDANTTYAYSRLYPDLDYTVTGKRELWILGSTDNFEVNEEGAAATVGDVDAYNVNIEPCGHLTGAAKTTCEATDHTVLAQITIRDFVKELSPMLIVTKPDRSIFRGHSIYGRMTEIDPTFEESDPLQIGAMCTAGNTASDGTVTFAAGDPGIVTWTAHTLVDGDTISFTATTGTLPRGLSPYYPYTVAVLTANTLSLLDAYGDPVQISQQGMHTALRGAAVLSDVQIAIASPAVITKIAHGLIDGDTVSFRTDGILPSGILPGRTYYVVNSAANDFEVSLTNGGAAVDAVAGISGTFVAHTGDASTCADGGFANARVFSDALTRQDSSAYAHTFDNFLSMGRLGFPYTTQNTLGWIDQPECPDFRCYLAAESKRQHFIFKLGKDEKSKSFTYYPSANNLDIPASVSVLEGDSIGKLASIKRKIDGCQTPDNQGDAFIAECTSVANLTESECLQVCGSAGLDVQNKVLSYVASEKIAILCKPGAFCMDHYTLTSQGSYTKPWIPLNRFYWYGSSVGSDSYYYRPAEPTAKTGYCSGQPGSGTTQTNAPCDVKMTNMGENSDIRHQLNVKKARLRQSGNCMSETLANQFDVCIDAISWDQEIAPSAAYISVRYSQATATDRVRNRYMPIATRAGELLGKPERLQYVMFKIPGTGGVANMIVGGRDKSQGKYLLRVRVKD